MRDGLPAATEGAAPAEMLLVVMGEKGRSQLQRDMRESIYATVAGAWGGIVQRGAAWRAVWRAWLQG